MTEKVYEMIMDIRNSGECNMLDTIAVQNEAYKKGYYELVIFIKDHKKEYVKFIFTGAR